MILKRKTINETSKQKIDALALPGKESDEPDLKLLSRHSKNIRDYVKILKKLKKNNVQQ